MPFEDATDYFGRKAPALKKTCLSRPFAGVLGGLGELAPVDVAGAFELAVAAVVGDGFADLLGGNAAPGELEAQPGCAETGRRTTASPIRNNDDCRF